MQVEVFVRAISSWRRGEQTLSEELAKGIEIAILDGRIGRDMRLPSERSLASALGIGRVTVGAAYAVLRTDGWIETSRGAGSRARLPRGLDAQIDPGAPAPDGAIDLARAAPVAPLPTYLAAIGRATEGFGSHAQDPTIGALTELRAEIAARYTAQGLATRPEQIMVTSGVGASLTLLARHTIAPGARVLVESPTYPGAIEVLRSARLRPTGWPISGGWDTEVLGTLLEEVIPALVYLVPDFHNPTGALASGEDRERIAAAVRRTGATLVIDEAMRDIDLRGNGAKPIPQFPDEPNVLRLGSLNKTVWAGLCLGWLRGPAATIEAVSAKPESYYLTPSILDQLVGLELLRDMDTLVDHRRQQLRCQLCALLEVLDRLPELRLVRVPEGGLTTWVELPLEISSAKLTRGAPDHGLHLLPGGRFSPDGTLDRFLRLPFTQPPEALREAEKSLRQLLASQKS